MSKRFLTLSLLGTFALLCALQPVPVQASDEEMMDTLVGCLNPGDEEGTFVLTNEEMGEVAVTGEGLDAHSDNHEVMLTGEWVEDEEGDKHFEASKIAHKGICA